MKMIVGSDEHTHLTDALVDDLRQRGHEVTLIGPLGDEALQWPEIGRAVGQAVAEG